MNHSSKSVFFLALCAVLFGLLISAPPLTLADQDKSKDHDSNGPIKVGYAIITPTSAATAGLVVFETFGENQGNNILQTGVLPSTMTVHSALFANADGRLSRNMGIAFANPSATPANVQLTLRDDKGVTIATGPLVLDALEHTAFFITQLFENKKAVPIDFTGTIDIVSDIPIATMGLRSRGPMFTTIPATILGPAAPVPLIGANVGGPAAVILAQFAAGGGWASEIVVANLGPVPMTVRVDLFASDGTPLTTTLNGQTASSFQNINIPAQGVVTLAPRNKDGDSDF